MQRSSDHRTPRNILLLERGTEQGAGKNRNVGLGLIKAVQFASNSENKQPAVLWIGGKCQVQNKNDMKTAKRDLRVGEMLRFIAANVDDYGFRYMDTTCDWDGWFGHGIDTPNKWRFGADNFHDLLANMVNRIKQERVTAKPNSG